MPRKLQSDPIECRFSQYCQISGERFLVSLREVKSSERILSFRSLLKVGINAWEHTERRENWAAKGRVPTRDSAKWRWNQKSLHVGKCLWSGGNSCCKFNCLHCQFNCQDCKEIKNKQENINIINKYFGGLSRGGLTVFSYELLEFVCSSFAILSFADTLMISVSVRKLNKSYLEKCAPQSDFACKRHDELCRKFAIKMLVNVSIIISNNSRATILEK